MRLEGLYRAVFEVDWDYLIRVLDVGYVDRSIERPHVWAFGVVFEDAENAYHFEGNVMYRDNKGRYVITENCINSVVTLKQINRYTGAFGIDGVMIFEGDYLGRYEPNKGAYIPSLSYVEKYEDEIVINSFGKTHSITQGEIECCNLSVVGNLYQDAKLKFVRGDKPTEDFN